MKSFTVKNGERIYARINAESIDDAIDKAMNQSAKVGDELVKENLTAHETTESESVKPSPGS